MKIMKIWLQPEVVVVPYLADTDNLNTSRILVT